MGRPVKAARSLGGSRTQPVRRATSAYCDSTTPRNGPPLAPTGNTEDDMPTITIIVHDGWYAIAVRSGAYERIEPTMYSTRDAAQRRVLMLLGH